MVSMDLLEWLVPVEVSEDVNDECSLLDKSLSEEMFGWDGVGGGVRFY